MALKLKKTVQISRNFEMILLAAERYACGRMSYIVSTVEQYIENLLPELSDWCIDNLSRDLKEKEEQEARMESGKYQFSVWGMDCDKAEWMRLKAAIEAERRKRGA